MVPNLLVKILLNKLIFFYFKKDLLNDGVFKKMEHVGRPSPLKGEVLIF